MTTLSDHLRAGAFIVSEANGARSRDTVTILGGTGGAGVVLAGTVLGKLTSGGQYVPSPASGSDGSQTAIAVLFDDVDATDADVEGVVIISGDAEVRASDLLYDASVDTDNEKATKATELDAVGIKVRDSNE